MRTITTNDPQKLIRQLKCHTEAGQIRLTFLWPLDMEQVYIFKTESPLKISELNSNNARLFTLQEYKKLGGYVEPLPSGAFTYYVFPFTREGSEDVLFSSENGEENAIAVTGQIPIQFSLTEKTGFFKTYKTYLLSMLSQQHVKSDVLCYVKKEGSYPANSTDGTVYFLGNTLEAGITGQWEIKTKKNEYIRVFVRDPEMAGVYLLKGGL